LKSNQKYYATADERAKAVELWKQGATTAELAEQLGVSSRAVDTMRLSGELPLPKRATGSGRKPRLRELTPREIRSRATLVRNTWSEFELLNRKAGPGRVATDFELHEHPTPYIPRTYSLNFWEGSTDE
jgi:hypothetical protein